MTASGCVSVFIARKQLCWSYIQPPLRWPLAAHTLQMTIKRVWDENKKFKVNICWIYIYIFGGFLLFVFAAGEWFCIKNDPHNSWKVGSMPHPQSSSAVGANESQHYIMHLALVEWPSDGNCSPSHGFGVTHRIWYSVHGQANRTSIETLNVLSMKSFKATTQTIYKWAGAAIKPWLYTTLCRKVIDFLFILPSY